MTSPKRSPEDEGNNAPKKGRGPDEAGSEGAKAEEDVPKKTIQFGKWPIDAREVFLETPLSVAIVNYKPVVDGHVLVLSRRVVPRFAELARDEVEDLWVTAQRVGKVVEAAYEASSLTFAIQDGGDAGQTVAHVHIHILPRKKGDFEKNDQIYDEIEKNEKALAAAKGTLRMDEEEERKPRTMEDMAAEATKLKALFA